ncbi:MAG TPA: OB-fold domain-containing protein [Acidimicrobiales bacterium]|nr:OB-fold domain-containing protein [Acidimicrobiales bacterium]
MSDARPEPPTSATTAPFWDATREQRLTVQWCRTCAEPFWYPRDFCPGCLGTDLEWRPSAGTGRVYAVTVEHRPQDPRLADRAPYAVALIDLDDGIRMMANVVEVDPASVAVGASVAVTWEPLPDGRNLPMFTLRDDRHG